MHKLIKIYGERNTSTNYIQKLIQINLDAIQLRGDVPSYLHSVQSIFPGKEWVKDLYFFLTYKNNLGWKHTRVKSISEMKQYKTSERRISIVTISKNPYSWLLSLYKRPYHTFSQKHTDFETFLRTPWKTVGRDNCEKLLKNPVQLWNIKNQSYIQLTELNSLSITAESIVQNPQLIIDRISNHFSIEKTPDYFKNHQKSTKNKDENFDFYRNYYLQEKWKDRLSKEAISIVNETLDTDIMSHFGYELLS